MKTPKQKIVELSTNEVKGLLDRAETTLNEEDYKTIKAVFESYAYVTDLLEDKATTLARLRKLLFGAQTEKTRDVVPPLPGEPPSPLGESPDPATVPAVPGQEKAAPAPGHGRNGADDYGGAERIRVPHAELKSGDPCPECKQGTVYEVAQPGVLVRIRGQAPVQARVYELQKLRCNLCGVVFTADAPEGVGPEKYDATSAAMIALLKYGSGLPFNRLDGLQADLGIPLPASTQWDIVHAAATRVRPAHEELIRQAAQGEVMYNDDTTVKILQLMGKRAREPSGFRIEEVPASPDPNVENRGQRRGLFTSGIVSTNKGRRIALFFSGQQHAGENLADVLARRAQDAGPPIQMCDALARNLPASFKTLLANCLAHGRRPFVEVAESFPDECRYVLERLGEVYKNDDLARKQKMTPEARLRFHRTQSGPIMDTLQSWCRRQFEDRRVEPNSALGKAIAYLLNHWEALTLFLRQAGAPLDNNICERALKLCILHRKNALFYRSLNGAHVGDIFMSLIHTCQLSDVNPFDYLTELHRHAKDLSVNPSKWMPWNYRDTLAESSSSPDATR